MISILLPGTPSTNKYCHTPLRSKFCAYHSNPIVSYNTHLASDSKLLLNILYKSRFPLFTLRSVNSLHCIILSIISFLKGAIIELLKHLLSPHQCISYSFGEWWVFWVFPKGLTKQTSADRVLLTLIFFSFLYALFSWSQVLNFSNCAMLENNSHYIGLEGMRVGEDGS